MEGLALAEDPAGQAAEHIAGLHLQLSEQQQQIDALELKVQAGENLKLQLAKVRASETTLETNLIIDSVGESFNSARSLRLWFIDCMRCMMSTMMLLLG